jgi:hypothetical protein
MASRENDNATEMRFKDIQSYFNKAEEARLMEEYSQKRAEDRQAGSHEVMHPFGYYLTNFTPSGNLVAALHLLWPK